MSKIKTLVVRIGIALTIAVMSLLGIALPASAAGTSDIKIVNSSGSDGNIRVYKTDNSWSMKLTPGQATPWVNDTGSNPVRVEIYPGGRYYIGIEGQGYGDCHNAPNPASNPPSGTYPKYVKYRTEPYYC
jgi:hypothetical protein